MDAARQFVKAILAQYPASPAHRGEPISEKHIRLTTTRCTFMATGFGHVLQPQSHCYTCVMDVCVACAATCHPNHYVKAIEDVCLRWFFSKWHR